MEKENMKNNNIVDEKPNDNKKYFSIDICVERVVPQWSTLEICSEDYSKEQIEYIIENFETMSKRLNKPINHFIPKRNPYFGIDFLKFKSDVSKTKIRKKSVGVRELEPPIGYVTINQSVPYEHSKEEWSGEKLQFRKIDRWKWDEYFSGLLEDSRKNPNFDEEEFNNLKTN